MVLPSPSFEHSAPHTLFASWNETTHSDKQIFKFWLIVFSLKNPPIFFLKAIIYFLKILQTHMNLHCLLLIK